MGKAQNVFAVDIAITTPHNAEATSSPFSIFALVDYSQISQFPGFVMSQDVLAFINSSIPALQHLTTKLASELLFRARSKPGAALFVGAAIWIVFSSLRRRNAPPGPPRLPLLGNIFQVPLQLQFIPFTEWSKQYGMYHSTRRTCMGYS